MNLFKIDHKEELFWLTLKGILNDISFENINIMDEINKISNDLNLLQKNAEYVEISKVINNFLYVYTKSICVCSINGKNPISVSRFIRNLNKWIIDFEIIFDSNTQFYYELSVILSGYIDKNINLYYKFIEKIIEYVDHRENNTTNELIEDKLFVLSIVLNAHNMIDFIKKTLRNYELYFIDLESYKKHKFTKSYKLINIINSNNTEHYKKILNSIS